MIRGILYALAGLFALTGLFLLVSPQKFYDVTPGVAMMGPYNSHFIRDVGFAFLASGGMVGWGTLHHIRPVVFCGAIWPSMHALFHIHMWGMRNFALDIVTATDFFGLVVPACLAFWAGNKLGEHAK